MHILDHTETDARMQGQPRTFKLKSPHMKGDDIAAFQKVLNAQFATWQVDYHVKVDGDYGVATRDMGRSVLYGLGIDTAKMDAGATPELRIKVRNKDLTVAERKLFHSTARRKWRLRLRARHEGGGVAPPLAKIITHANGFHAGHDGTDLICPEDSPGFAICKAKVVRADASGWWGLGARPSPGHPVSDGDGIVILQSLVNIGPIKKGMLICYGHAEGARVNKGQTVKAGQHICRAGFANAPHFHFMVNSGGSRFWNGNRPRGVGDRDPWPIVKYAIEHS